MNTTKTAQHFVGEVRRSRGRMSMCVMVDAQFGGGEGDVWVTEDVIYDFATKDTHRFYRGICRGLDPLRKVVRFEVVEGPTWGHRAKGQLCEISVEAFSHIRIAHVHGTRLIEGSQRAVSKAEAETAFVDISIDELVKASKHQHEAEIEELLGRDAFAYVKEVLTSYIELCRAFTPKGVNGYKMPSFAEGAAKRRLLSVINKGVGNDD